MTTKFLIYTYYISPIIALDLEIIINYYHKEYLEEDYIELFTVRVTINGKNDIVVKDLQAGYHSV